MNSSMKFLQAKSFSKLLNLKNLNFKNATGSLFFLMAPLIFTADLSSETAFKAPSGIEQQYTANKAELVFTTQIHSNQILRIDPLTGSQLAPINLKYIPHVVAQTHDGQKAFVLADQSNKIEVINLLSGMCEKTIKVPKTINTLTIAPDNKFAYITFEDSHTLYTFDLTTGAGHESLELTNIPSKCVVDSAGETMYVIYPESSEVTIIDLPTSKPINYLFFKPYPVSIALSPNGKTLHIAQEHKDRLLSVDVKSGRFAKSPITQDDTIKASDVTTINISGDGKRAYLTHPNSTLVSTVDLVSIRMPRPKVNPYKKFVQDSLGDAMALFNFNLYPRDKAILDEAFLALAKAKQAIESHPIYTEAGKQLSEYASECVLYFADQPVQTAQDKDADSDTSSSLMFIESLNIDSNSSSEKTHSSMKSESLMSFESISESSSESEPMDTPVVAADPISTAPVVDQDTVLQYEIFETPAIVTPEEIIITCNLLPQNEPVAIEPKVTATEVSDTGVLPSNPNEPTTFEDIKSTQEPILTKVTTTTDLQKSTKPPVTSATSTNVSGTNIPAIKPGGQQNKPSLTPNILSLSSNAAPTTGGKVIKITGTNFTGATKVTFGNKKAVKFTVDSPEHITATVPSGSGTVDIRVTTPNGVAKTTVENRLNYSTTPTIQKVSPNRGPAKGGARVTITGSNFTNVTKVTFGNKEAASFTVVSPTKIEAIAPSGSHRVRIVLSTETETSAIAGQNQYGYFKESGSSKGAKKHKTQRSKSKSKKTR